MALLENGYGHPLKILASYQKETKKWPSITAGDAIAFKQFHNFILKCESAISMQNWNVLHSPETLSIMIPKFPRHIRDRWNRKGLSLRKRHQKKPTLLDLSYFSEEESALADDLLFSNSAVDEYLDKLVKPT